MTFSRLLAPTLLLCSGASAQWLNYPDPAIPRLKDGKPNLSAPTPHTKDGKPDLTGVWMHERTTPEEITRIFGAAFEAELDASPIGMEAGTQHKYALNILLDFKPGESPLRPEAEAVMKRRAAELVQAPKETLILYEVDNLHRQVFADGRQFPATFEFPAYLGYSVGHWEGDTFVVESRGFNDRTPIDAVGHPRSEEMHVTERFHRRDFGHLDYDMTFDDPQMYMKKFTVKIPHELVADNDIFEMFCGQNEKDRAHMVK